MVLVGTHEGKRSLEMTSGKWEDNIEMDLEELWWDGVDSIYLPQESHMLGALVNTALKMCVPYNADTFLTSLQLLDFAEGLCSMELGS
jgi:hypothetical protein